MAYLSKVQFFVVLAAGFLVGQAALAETSEWMKGRDSFGYARKLQSSGMIVTRMECKDSGRTELDVNSAMVRFTYGPNTKMVKWLIDGWVNLGENERYWKGRGYKLASHTVFVRHKTGLRLYCTIFHKN